MADRGSGQWPISRPARELIPDHVEPAAKPQQKRPRSPLHLHPVGWFENAISFRSAADLLFEAITSPDNNKRPLRDPVYFLYHHAVELALKACLASRGLKVPEGGKDQHDIGKLFEWCRKKKLLGLDDKHFNMNNLIDLLGQGNRWQRYRYPGPNPNNEHDHFIPDLSWLHALSGAEASPRSPHASGRWPAARHPGARLLRTVRLRRASWLRSARPISATWPAARCGFPCDARRTRRGVATDIARAADCWRSRPDQLSEPACETLVIKAPPSACGALWCASPTPPSSKKPSMTRSRYQRPPPAPAGRIRT